MLPYDWASVVLHPAFDVSNTGGAEVAFADGPAVVRSGGPLSVALARALVRPTPAIAAARTYPAVPVDTGLYAITQWMRAGLVVRAPEWGWDDGDDCAATPAESVGAAFVGFTGGEAGRIVRGLGGRVPGEARVVFARRYLDPALPDVLAAGDGRPVVLVRPVGRAFWVGPYLGAGPEVAYAALADRLRRSLRAEALLVRLGAECLRPARVVPEALGFATLARLLARPERLVGRIVAVPADGGRARSHRTIPADPPPPGSDPSVRDAWRRLRPLVSPISGVVPEVVRCRTAARGLALYSAPHSLSHAPASLDDLAETTRWTAGRGETADEARLAALCEAVERTAGVYRGDEVAVRSPLAGLDGALSPDALQGFSDAQFARRAATNAVDLAGYHVVPERLDPDAPLSWSVATSLVTGRTHYVPTAWAYYACPDPVGARACVADSNGCAAGPTREAAVLGGLFELVERDAVALWWYHRRRVPVAPFDEAHPYVAAARRAMRRLGRDVWALDVTHDLGVPVVAAVSRRRTSPEQVLLGFGCHPDPAVAARRALSELVQVLPHDDRIPRRAADVPAMPSWGVLADRWLAEATVAAHPHLLPDPGVARVRGDALDPSLPAGPALDGLLGRVAQAVGDVLVVDQTRADVPLPVVRVVAPGLRHFWRRLGPGRLYTVPVAMGWASGPAAEADLNPTPLFT